MKRAVIFVNGNLTNATRVKKIVTKEDCLIAADGGVKQILELGLIPRIVIGDFDSTPLPLQKKLTKMCRDQKSLLPTSLIKYPVKKDKTDFELAIDYCLEKKFKEIIICGILGDRIDHFIGNILLLVKVQQENKTLKIKIIEGNQEVFIVNKEIVINGQIKEEVSIIPITKLKGIITKGLEYKLNNEIIPFGSTRGISNVFNKTTAKVRISDGIGLIIKSFYQ
jgi:thiamine pyrophosphokinase